MNLANLRKLAGITESDLPPGVNSNTGLSRNDVDANISMLLDDITDLCQQVAAASEANTQAQQDRVQDKWGIQGNLAHVRQSLNDILQFIKG